MIFFHQDQVQERYIIESRGQRRSNARPDVRYHRNQQPRAECYVLVHHFLPGTLQFRCETKMLLALRPHVAQLQESESPLVFCMGDGTAMTPGCFSQRLPRIWQRLGLTFEVPVGMTGLNGARHASVNENRKRRKLTSDERAEEAAQAKKRLSSVHMAETVYA